MQLKAGKYYIGDPCYLFDKSWSELIDLTGCFESEEIIEIYGYKCIVGGTAHGDGTYNDNYNKKYWVDAGLIGCLPIELINIDKKESIDSIEASLYIHIVEFKNNFEVNVCNGVFNFGHICIDTNDFDKEEDEDFYDNYDNYSFEDDEE